MPKCFAGGDVLPFCSSVDGESIYYEDVGGGPALIFLHSLGASSAIWHEQLTRFSPAYRCLAPDCRGHGRSSHNRPVTQDAIVGDIVAMMDDVGVRAAHVIGLSMGGCWALRLYELHPRRVLSLTLCDTFAAVEDPEGPVRAREADIRSQSPEEFGRRYADGTLQPHADPEVRRMLAAAVAAVDRDAYVETARACFGSRQEHMLTTISVPTLVLIGDSDLRTPMPLAETLHQGIRGSRLAVVPQAGHLSNLDNPNAFDLALTEHLSGATRGGT